MAISSCSYTIPVYLGNINRIKFVDPQAPTPSTLIFLIRYNWQNRRTEFCRFDNAPPDFINTQPEETLHRCSVGLTPIPSEETILAEEVYNESDSLDAATITPRDVLNRVNLCRVFPVLGPNKAPGVSVQWCRGKDPLEAAFEDRTKKVEDTVTLHQTGGHRIFKITVEEL